MYELPPLSASEGGGAPLPNVPFTFILSPGGGEGGVRGLRTGRVEHALESGV